jgi:hypothetical protein
MARSQEKATVQKEDLPAVSKLSNELYGYIVRYRIISEDQNRFSHWAPLREVQIPEPTAVSGAVSLSGSILNVVWGDEEIRPRYDIFVKFDSQQYFYHGTSPTHQYSIIVDAQASSVQVSIQIESTNKEFSEFLKIYESNLETIA